MSKTLTLSPVTRIEGHLAIHTDTEPAGDGSERRHRVKEARCEGEMFRGFEKILQGRDPLDAQQITARICGVCPTSHIMAALLAEEAAFGMQPAANGRLLRNLVLGADFLQSHILHFYHLAALDFVDVKAILSYGGSDRSLKAVKSWVEQSLAAGGAFPAAPFLPRFEVAYARDADRNVRLLAHYVEALEIRRVCHEMGAVFGARMPHPTSLVPGGCTQVPTMERILSYRSRLQRIQAFVEGAYLPDIVELADEFPGYFDVGRGVGNFLSYGAFPLDDQGRRWTEPGVVINGRFERLDPQQITESVACSRFSSPSRRHPFDAETVPSAAKQGAYSWIKAPRYRDEPLEVGPLARLMVAYLAPADSWVKREIDAFRSRLNLPVEKLVSVLGRHAARAIESAALVRQSFAWLDEIDLGAPPCRPFDIPRTAQGVGLIEAPRGALGHWLEIDNHLIKRYQCVVPTSWNCAPRDEKGVPGPVEKALEGSLVEDPAQPVELGRIVRSFDPCIACAVH